MFPRFDITPVHAPPRHLFASHTTVLFIYPRVFLLFFLWIHSFGATDYHEADVWDDCTCIRCTVYSITFGFKVIRSGYSVYPSVNTALSIKFPLVHSVCTFA